ncbi:MAG: FAD-dependent oxidoreductase, partial [Planctomycetaceae bacterium]
MADLETDVVVIGAGPGGYPAAFACADHGRQVTIIDQSAQLGGVCLHRGCIPSKALLHLAKLIQEAREAAHVGVSFGEPKIDIAQVRKFKNDVIAKLV